MHGPQDGVPLSEKSLQGVAGEFSFASSWGTQFRVLLRRSWMQTSRDKLPLFIAGFQVPPLPARLLKLMISE